MTQLMVAQFGAQAKWHYFLFPRHILIAWSMMSPVPSCSTFLTLTAELQTSVNM